MRPNLVRVLAVALGLVTVAGCSTGKQVADKVKQQFDEQVGLTVDVSCPKDAKAKKDAAFDCTATYQSTPMTIHILFSDDTHFTFTPVGLVAEPDVAGQSAAAFLTAQGGNVDTIDCGTATLFVPADSTFPCDVSFAGQTFTNTFTVDSSGAISDVKSA
jgi:hypothetical protein